MFAFEAVKCIVLLHYCKRWIENVNLVDINVLIIPNFIAQMTLNIFFERTQYVQFFVENSITVLLLWASTIAFMAMFKQPNLFA